MSGLAECASARGEMSCERPRLCMLAYGDDGEGLDGLRGGREGNGEDEGLWIYGLLSLAGGQIYV